MRTLVLAVVLVSACGSVESSPEATGGAGGQLAATGGAGGAASAAGGLGGAAGLLAAGGRGGELGATGGIVGTGGIVATGGTPATGGQGGAAAILACSSAVSLSPDRAFGSAGPGATQAVSVDAGALKMNFTVPSNSYAIGGIAFDACDASSFNALSFGATVSGGSIGGCSWRVQLKTRGGQSMEVANLAAPTSTSKAYVERFTSFTGGSDYTELAAVQWEIGAAGAGCTVELRTSDVGFMLQ